MNQTSFLTLVRSSGGFRSDGEASRAANAVFGTIKVWLTPAAADRVRQALPQDASRIWQFSPAAFSSGQRHRRSAADRSAMTHFLLKIQQLGGYRSHEEARGAACSVLKALARAIPDEISRLIGQAFPGGVPAVCPVYPEQRAA